MDSFMTRMGGKKLLREEIISRFPADFGRYVEVFGGAGWVLFARDQHAKIEVFNDADGELINLFRVVKYHAAPLQAELQGLLNSREVFNTCLAVPPWALTDIQRAARYYILIRESYGGKQSTFRCSPYSIDRAIDYLSAAQKRLKKVVIERKDYADLIKVYDRPDALFYCDPPYHGTERYYDVPFSEDDHRHLKAILNGLKGRFILSYNDDDFVRNLYSGYHIDAVSRNNNLSPGKPYRELVIRNY